MIGPTHEEVVTDIARREIKSYRQLPVNFYQIQTKFRDEIRPRFGVMRGREFIMKDAYSFDKDAGRPARVVSARCTTPTCASSRASAWTSARWRRTTVRSAARGSHEFQVIADTGEDAIVYCPTSDYAANIEAAEALPLSHERAAPAEDDDEDRHAGQGEVRGRRRTARTFRSQRTIKSIVLADRKRRRRADHLAADAARRPSTSTKSRRASCRAWPTSASRPKPKSSRRSARRPATSARSARRSRSR